MTNRSLTTAVSLLRSGRLDEAQRQYLAVLDRQPEHALALHHLGIIALQRGRADKAVELITRTLASEEAMADAHSNLGLAYGALGKLEGARACFRRAIELRPGYAEAHYNLALVHDAGGAAEAALAGYDEAIGLRPGYPEAHANRAMALHALGRLEEAAEGYRRALELAPGLHTLWCYRALAVAHLGRREEMQSALQQARANAPGEPLIAVAEAILADREGDVAASTGFMADALLRLAQRGLPSPAVPAAHECSYPVALYPQAVAAVMRLAGESGLRPFLYGGTLLGAMREGDFLSFDKDIDFGIDAAVGSADILALFARDPDFEPVGEHDADAPLVAVRYRERVAIDFFRFFDAGDHLWCGVPVRGTLMKWRHRPFGLRQGVFRGVPVLMPEDPAAVLEETYGDWRTPNPYFGLFASPNIEGGFPPVSRFVAYGLLVRAAFSGRHERLADLCRQVLKLAPHDAPALALRDCLANAACAPPATGGAQAAIVGGIGSVFDELPG